MKRIRSILTLICFLIFCQAAQAQINSPDTMAHRIFTILKTKDEKAFVALFPNPEQMIKMLSKVMANLVIEIAKADTTNKKEVNQGDFNALMLEGLKKKTTPEQLAKEYGRFAKNFRDIIEKGEQRGIDWNKIALLRYTYDTITMNDEMAVKIFGNDGMKSMKGRLYFTSADTVYEVSFKETLYLPEERGWYGAELHRLKKENETITNEMEMKEEILESSDIVEPPPPPPPKKPKAKTKTASTKSKTKAKS
jgi:hypothetical protein